MFRASLLLALAASAAAFVVPQPVFRNFHSQDELGGFHFGFSGGPSSRAEHRDHLGVVRGSYNLVDALGNVQKYTYIAGPHTGFQLLSGTHLPVGPAPVAVPAVAPLVAPVPVEETPEVAAARSAHLAALEKAAADAASALTA